MTAEEEFRTGLEDATCTYLERCYNEGKDHKKTISIVLEILTQSTANAIADSTHMSLEDACDIFKEAYKAAQKMHGH